MSLSRSLAVASIAAAVAVVRHVRRARRRRADLATLAQLATAGPTFAEALAEYEAPDVARANHWREEHGRVRESVLGNRARMDEDVRRIAAVTRLPPWLDASTGMRRSDDGARLEPADERGMRVARVDIGPGIVAPEYRDRIRFGVTGTDPAISVPELTWPGQSEIPPSQPSPAQTEPNPTQDDRKVTTMPDTRTVNRNIRVNQERWMLAHAIARLRGGPGMNAILDEALEDYIADHEEWVPAARQQIGRR